MILAIDAAAKTRSYVCSATSMSVFAGSLVSSAENRSHASARIKCAA